MSGLTDRAGGELPSINKAVEQAHQAWEASMLRQMESLGQAVATEDPAVIARRCGAKLSAGELCLDYWGDTVRIRWPDMHMFNETRDRPCSVFDGALLLYYLKTADGVPLADRWVSFRELPGGGFYHQAFQGYSGDRLARTLGSQPEHYERAATTLGGVSLSGLSGLAYAFMPLPRFPVAALLWPGDDEFPARASILFDAEACHYMTIDGCALLGSGLVSRIIKSG
jgi:hypothetical protein